MTADSIGSGVHGVRRLVLCCARIAAPLTVLALGLFVRPTPTAARPDYTRRTKQECAYCHLPGGWFLNDAGKYFEQHRTLNGYKPPEGAGKQSGNQNAKSK